LKNIVITPVIFGIFFEVQNKMRMLDSVESVHISCAPFLPAPNENGNMVQPKFPRIVMEKDFHIDSEAYIKYVTAAVECADRFGEIVHLQNRNEFTVYIARPEPV
jgi:hypothetical protein